MMCVERLFVTVAVLPVCIKTTEGRKKEQRHFRETKNNQEACSGKSVCGHLLFIFNIIMLICMFIVLDY